MKVLTLNIPDNLDPENMQVTLFIASKTYEQRALSLGQVTKLARITERAFVKLLGLYNVSVFYPIADLSIDVENA